MTQPVNFPIKESDWALAHRDGSSHESDDVAITIHDQKALELATQMFNPDTKESVPSRRIAVTIPIDSLKDLNSHLIHQEFTEPHFSDSFVKLIHSLCPCLSKQSNKGL